MPCKLGGSHLRKPSLKLNSQEPHSTEIITSCLSTTKVDEPPYPSPTSLQWKKNYQWMFHMKQSLPICLLNEIDVLK